MFMHKLVCDEGYALPSTNPHLGIFHIIQYNGPMPDAPWDKDQWRLMQNRGPVTQYNKSTPYATSENMEHSKQACLHDFGS